MEPYVPIDPPFINHSTDAATIHEFFVDLGVYRPTNEVLKMISEWLLTEPPRTMLSIHFSYLPETNVEPPMLCAEVIMGGPIDVG